MRAVYGYLKRLIATGAAYQASSLLSPALAVVTLPLYTRHLTEADYGYAETLLTTIILASIVLRLGLGDALVRFWFVDHDPAQRVRVTRSATGTVFAISTAAALIGLLFAGDLSQALLRHRDATLMAYGLLGLWAFTNLEMAYAILRAEERRRPYVVASVSNVLLTVALTVVLVVIRDDGARGYVLGNWGASALVLLALWWRLRRQLGLPTWRQLEPMLRYGLPTVPADASVFALNVIDRAYLLRARDAAATGLYALSVKLATAVIVAVRGFQAAWPPLAYSIKDDDEARRFYAFVTTAYVLVTGLVVAGATLEGRWIVRVFAAPKFYGAHAALPWVALGWALYGLVLVLTVIAGRARVTTRNFPAAIAGLAANVLLLVALVGPLGIAGAGIALAGAYLVTLAVLYWLTRKLFVVPFEWRRLALLVGVMGGISVGGELLLPTSGLAGFLSRAVAFCAIPLVLVALRFFRPEELARLRALRPARR